MTPLYSTDHHINVAILPDDYNDESGLILCKISCTWIWIWIWINNEQKLLLEYKHWCSQCHWERKHKGKQIFILSKNHTAEHAKFTTWSFREFEVPAIFTTCYFHILRTYKFSVYTPKRAHFLFRSLVFSLFVIFMFWEPTHSVDHASSFCLKITWVIALREEASQTNVILRYILLAAILSAVCSVIQQS